MPQAILVDEKGIPYGSTFPLPVQFSDNAGHTGVVTTFGEAVVATRTADIAHLFTYGLPPAFLTLTTANGGTTGINTHRAQITTSTDANGSASIESKESIFYRPGHELEAMWTVAFTAGVANSTQKTGLINSEEAIAVGYDGTTFTIWKMDDTVESNIAQTDWNDVLDGTGNENNPSGFLLSPTNTCIYKVRFGYLGIANIEFHIHNGSDWTLFHTIQSQRAGKQIGIQTAVNIANPSLPMRMEVRKTGGDATDITILCGCWSAGTLIDPMVRKARTTVVSGSTTALDSTEIPIVSIKRPVNYKGDLNHIPAIILGLSLGVDGNKPVTVRLRRNATLTGENFVSHDPDNFMMLADTSASIVSGGTIIAIIKMGKAGDKDPDLEKRNLQIFANDEITLTAQGATGGSNIDFLGALTWDEKL